MSQETTLSPGKKYRIAEEIPGKVTHQEIVPLSAVKHRPWARRNLPPEPSETSRRKERLARELAKLSTPGMVSLPLPEAEEAESQPALLHRCEKYLPTAEAAPEPDDEPLPECPFYRRDNGKSRIWCEGIAEDCTVVLQCHTREAFRIQWQTFCTARYQNCELYRAAMEKYEDG